jgi:hypothetical protein
MKFTNAFNKLISGKEITREALGKTTIAMDSGAIVRKKSTGAVSAARLGSADLLADDWAVVKIVKK